jgi:LmbE family N-acetylglucosaminyl deacetylase
MKRNFLQIVPALLVVSLLSAAPRAQQTPPATQSPEGRIALYQALLDLTNPWTVMCIAAHPDDEDGTSLIVMRRKYGAHTVSLFTTFGEGGQNAIGPELYEEMGAIRARETMAASEIQGSEPHFLGLQDFGFSKSADEAFKFWGHDEALRRMVLQFRKLRPDVIITNHNSTGGHGHHQATGRLELEAFDAAADPKRFPEQLKDGVTTWQVQRLFLRVGFGNRSPEQGEGTVTIDPNERDPIRGTVYAEEALRALQKHATQGPWPKTFADMLRFRNSQDGKLALTRYRLVREAKGAAPLPKDSHNFLDGLKLPEKIAKHVEPPAIDGKPITAFVDQRDRVLSSLLAAGSRPGATDVDPNDRYRLALRGERLGRAFAIASGLSIKLVPSSAPVMARSLFTFKVEISNLGPQKIQLGRLRLTVDLPDGRPRVTGDLLDGGPAVYQVPLALLTSLAPGKVFNRQIDMASGIAEITIPHKEHLYDGRFRGYLFAGHLEVKIGGVPFEIKVETSVDVAPPVEIAAITPSPAVLSPQSANAGERIPFTLTLTNHQNIPFEGDLTAANSVADSRADGVPVKLAAGESKTVTLMAERPPSVNLVPPGSITFLLQNKKVNSPTRTVSVVYSDARVAPNLHVGYLRGFDHSLPNALDALGVESKELTVNDVTTADLQKYSSIIVDNRVYESQPELIAANQKLLDYAKDGGTLIVFYHKSNEWNPDERRNRPQQLAPYKLILGGERITDETAPVTFIQPEHPLLNVPNKMGQEDFANWIQERGLYYPREWDPQYQALLQSNDPGEGPLKGGLLVAKYGSGHYIYSSMVWYRQLRGGLPGAYRMLANMISYGHSR